jgi:hypothetical protein
MAATAWDDEDIELDSDADVQNFQGGAVEHSDGGACDSAMWQLGACDELGCLSSDSDSDDGLYLPYHDEPSLASCCIPPTAGGRVANNESSHSSGDGGSTTRQHYWCCCCPLAPLQHQTQLICEQLCARGWHLHPSEVVPAERCPAMMPEGRGRPMAGRRVDFSNSAFHSAGWLFSDDPCEALYDRLQLATLVCPAGSPLAPRSPGTHRPCRASSLPQLGGVVCVPSSAHVPVISMPSQPSLQAMRLVMFGRRAVSANGLPARWVCHHRSGAAAAAAGRHPE